VINCVLHLLYQYFQVLVYVIFVIMQYTVSYREIHYPVNSSSHTVCSALLPKLLTATNAAMNIYSSCLCVHPLNHNHDTKEALCVTQFQFFYVPVSTKEALCVTQFQFFYVPVSIHYSFSIHYRHITTRSASQTLACTQVTRTAIKNGP